MTPEDLTALAAHLGLKTDMGRAALALSLADIQLLDRKQQDYGSGNISAFGELGVLVRANDKIERLKTLHRTGQQAVKDETVGDTWSDLSNYGLIARLVRSGTWT